MFKIVLERFFLKGCSFSLGTYHKLYLKVVMGGTMAQIFFKPEKNLEFFRLKICAIDATPGKLE